MLKSVYINVHFRRHIIIGHISVLNYQTLDSAVFGSNCVTQCAIVKQMALSNRGMRRDEGIKSREVGMRIKQQQPEQNAASW